jgi:alkylhydroperoxidase/carboxymuconolactone decarboxylase family protein YurZ
MTNTISGTEAMAAKYGDLVEHPPAMTPEAFAATLARRDSLDQHFAKTSLDFTSGVTRRRVLDERTRLLVQIGQFTVSKSHGHLERALRAALSGPAEPRDALESIFQCLIYGGDTVLEPALEIFVSVAAELGVLEQLSDDQLPLDARESTRSLAEERATWPAGLDGDSGVEEMISRYGWPGVSTGVRFRGRHHISILQHFDAMDPQFAALWEHFAYAGIYSRWVLDDKTRILCTVADLLALGATTSAKEHMRGALAAGASARELLEIVFISGAYFGFPLMTASLRTLEDVLTTDGRIDEIGSPAAHPYDVKKQS